MAITILNLFSEPMTYLCNYPKPLEQLVEDHVLVKTSRKQFCMAINILNLFSEPMTYLCNYPKPLEQLVEDHVLVKHRDMTDNDGQPTKIGHYCCIMLR